MFVRKSNLKLLPFRLGLKVHPTQSLGKVSYKCTPLALRGGKQFILCWCCKLPAGTAAPSALLSLLHTETPETSKITKKEDQELTAHISHMHTLLPLLASSPGTGQQLCPAAWDTPDSSPYGWSLRPTWVPDWPCQCWSTGHLRTPGTLPGWTCAHPGAISMRRGRICRITLNSPKGWQDVFHAWSFSVYLKTKFIGSEYCHSQGGITFRKRQLSCDLSTQSRSKCETYHAASSGSHLATAAGCTRRSDTGLWFQLADGFLGPELWAGGDPNHMKCYLSLCWTPERSVMCRLRC